MSAAIPWARPSYGERARRYVNDALDSTWISHGPYVERFEADFTKRLGAGFGITTSNGTTALQLALLALGIGPGDEVIVPDFTFVAPGNMVAGVGATPVFADIDPETWCVSPASVERCLTERTRAIVVVHVYGNVCDMDPLLALGRARSIPLVEDVAEACLSSYRGHQAGTLGAIGCFSFQATKTISMGEGGFVATDDPRLAADMRRLRDHGMERGRRYWHAVVGWNFRLTNLQAALGQAQLEEVDAALAERAAIYAAYRARLSSADGLRLQTFRPEVDPAVWTVGVRCLGGDRDEVMRRMAADGVETRPGFYPFSLQPPYQRWTTRPTPVAAEVAREVIALPCYPGLTPADVERVIDALLAARR